MLDIIDKVITKKGYKSATGPGEDEGKRAIPGVDNLYDCLTKLKEEFPQECLVYNESAEVMEIEEKRREKAYKLFNEMGEILSSMHSDGAKFKSQARFFAYTNFQ